MKFWLWSATSADHFPISEIISGKDLDLCLRSGIFIAWLFIIYACLVGNRELVVEGSSSYDYLTFIFGKKIGKGYSILIVFH